MYNIERPNKRTDPSWAVEAFHKTCRNSEKGKKKPITEGEKVWE